MAFEYFDVPYRYNETCIKLLFQSPKILFAFWDVADDDEQNFINKFGQEAYYSSRIYLELTNLTNNKITEIDINPFAKTWYIHIDEPNCKYIAKLCRIINNQKIDISTSNVLLVPTNTPHIPKDTHFKFVNYKTSKIAFEFDNNEAILAINNTGHFKITNIDENIITTNKYIQSNPSSMSNISSANRYLIKEGSNE